MNIFHTETCYIDSNGNLIDGPNRILVSNQYRYAMDDDSVRFRKTDGLKKVGNPVNGIYSSYVYTDPKTKKTESFDYIVSKETKEVIPFDALDCKTLYVLFCARNANCKTTTIVQYVRELPDILNLNNGIAYTEPLLTDQYPPEFRKALKNYEQGLIPEPTKASVISETIPMFLEYNGEKICIKFIDVPGEKRPDGSLPVFEHSDAIFLFLDLSNPNTLQDQAQRIRELTVNRTISANVPVYIILTKADLITYQYDGLTKYLWKQIPSTTEKTPYGKIRLQEKWRTDGGGFDYNAFRYSEQCIKEYMENCQPAIYAQLNSAFGRNNTHYFILGNYMRNADHNMVPKNRELYRVEQPLLHFLAEQGLYPSPQNAKPSATGANPKQAGANPGKKKKCLFRDIWDDLIN